MTQPQFSTKADEFLAAGLPLRDFWGVLSDIVPQFGGDRKYIQLPCTEVEVIETDPGVTWIHPVCQLELTAFFDNSTGKPRQFGDWWNIVESGEILGFPDFANLKGKRLHFKSTMRQYESRTSKNDDGTPVMVNAKNWQIVEVAGMGTGSTSNGIATINDLLQLLSDPKTQTEFTQAVISNQNLKDEYGGTDLFNGNLLSGLVGAGQVTMDGDKYQAVS
jgi:hypothetical protein